MLGIKKIDSVVFKAFIIPLIFTFTISEFVFLMQFLWKYIDDLVGKGLEFKLILQLLALFTFKVVPLALPLSILLSSTMTMGNFGENNELVACKSSGISTLRVMRSLIIFAFILSIGAFYFSNKILPYTNLKFITLLMDIRRHKPALDIKENVFYKGLSGYTLKIGKKSPNNSSIYDIIVYDHTSGYGNDNVILADKGEMTLSTDQRFMIFELFDGRQYQETRKRDKNHMQVYEQNIVEFKYFKKVFDLKEFKLNRSSEDLFKGYYEMLDFGQLKSEIDSMSREIRQTPQYIQEYNSRFLTFNKTDTTTALKTTTITQLKKPSQAKDTLAIISGGTPSNIELQSAISGLSSIKSYVEMQISDLNVKKEQISKFKVELYKKFMLSSACIILLLIGGGMGAIVRKGGLGMPILISTCFYMIFHIFNMIGDKLAQSGVIAPLIGAWLPSIVLFPIAVFLVYKATNDSTIFKGETYQTIFDKGKRWFRYFYKKKTVF